MNLFGIISLVIGLAVLVWWFGNSAENVQEANTQADVLDNTLNAAQNAADLLER